ncbi:MAG: hypothetical protein NZM07_07250, partial [Elioraea sp.]|nr:hypothetical protein [Elioraea sp.]
LVVYGEASSTAEEPRSVVDRRTGRVGRITAGGIAGLIGLRWQTPTDTTVILEYLHNGTGIRPQVLADALAVIDRAADRLEESLPPTPGDEVGAPARPLLPAPAALARLRPCARLAQGALRAPLRHARLHRDRRCGERLGHTAAGGVLGRLDQARASPARPGDGG